MNTPLASSESSPTLSFLAGGGQMGGAMRTHDWSSTSLGEPVNWPQAVKTLVGIMLSASQPMFLAWGPKRVLLYNDGYAPMLGQHHGHALGVPFFETWPEVVEEVGALFAKVFAGRPVNMDDIELHLDRVGHPREAHFSFSYSPVMDGEGIVGGLFCVCSETTETVFASRRQAQTAFQSGLIETLRPLSDPIEVQAAASRLLGEYLGANRVVYFEIRGDDYVIEQDFASGVRPLAGRYPVASFGDELLSTLLQGRTVVEADGTAEPNRSPSARDSFAAINVRGHVDVPLVKGGHFVAGMTVHCTDRREWSSHDVQLIEDTAERIWAAIEQVRAQAALKRSEERSAFVQRSSGVGVWYCDLPFDVLEWDDLVKAHFFLPPEALVTIETFYDRIVPEDREPTRQAIDSSIARCAEYDTVYRTRNPATGQVRWVRAIGRTFYQVDGTPTRFDGVTIDVSQQKLAEENLRQADRLKDEFLATLAHELRNPLAPLRNGLQILRIAAGDPAVLSRARAMMERQVDTMVRLVDDLLDVARISSGTIELRLQSESLQTVIARAVETAMPAIESFRHTLTVEAPPDPIVVNVDGARLAQVLANLIGNAAKYTPSGGRIEVDAFIQDGFAVTSVRDNGVGIATGALGQVFGMFSQLGETRSMSQGGLGIGLFLAKKLVGLHGGQIYASSDGPGQGSTFTVRLPRTPVDGESRGDETGAHTESAAPRQLRILVVDDNEDAGDSLALRLSLEGHQARVARDGSTGLTIANDFHPHVAFLDIGMPGMTGYELAQAIRSAALPIRPLLVALTGWGSPSDVKLATAAGFDRHLTKPASNADLVKVLEGISA